MKVTAIDEKGNEFEKEIKLFMRQPATWWIHGKRQPIGKRRKVISFGFPISYYFETLEDGYPYKLALSVDGAGRNHKGFPVTISADQINSAIELAKSIPDKDWPPE